MRILKKDNGSITLFVLIAMLFFGMFLVGMFLINANEEAVGTAQTARIKEIYERGVDNVDEVYETNKPRKPNAGEVVRIENNIKYTADGEGNEVPVPIGFSYIGEGTKETGFVIKNDTDENEFVWIPVSGMPYTYNRYAFVGGEINQVEDGIDTEFGTNSVKIKTSKSSSTYFVEELPNDEKASVEKHGGYYIARYEAGILQERTAKGEPATTLPIFRKTGDTAVYVYNFVKYDQAKTLSENLYKKSEDNVISKLCSNYAWDTALKFIDIQNPGWSTNSVGGDNTTLQGPGYHSVNNIYDIGGNVDEMVSGFYCSPEYQFILRRWEMFFTEIVQCIQHVI